MLDDRLNKINLSEWIILTDLDKPQNVYKKFANRLSLSLVYDQPLIHSNITPVLDRPHYYYRPSQSNVAHTLKC